MLLFVVTARTRASKSHRFIKKIQQIDPVCVEDAAEEINVSCDFVPCEVLFVCKRLQLEFDIF